MQGSLPLVSVGSQFHTALDAYIHFVIAWEVRLLLREQLVSACACFVELKDVCSGVGCGIAGVQCRGVPGCRGRSNISLQRMPYENGKINQRKGEKINVKGKRKKKGKAAPSR